MRIEDVISCGEIRDEGDGVVSDRFRLESREKFLFCDTPVPFVPFDQTTCFSRNPGEKIGGVINVIDLS